MTWWKKDTVKHTTGQRAFLLHMLFSVVLLASILTVANSADIQIAFGVRSLVLYYFSIASKDIQSVVIIKLWAIGVIIKLWAVGDPSLRSWSFFLTAEISWSAMVFQESRFQDEVSRPDSLSFYQMQKSELILITLGFVRLTVFRNKKTKNSTTEYKATQVHPVGRLWRTSHITIDAFII